MTDRIHALTVILDQDVRDDDVQPVIDAIRMVKHVISVEPHVTSLVDHSARIRVRTDLTTKLYDVLRSEV